MNTASRIFPVRTFVSSNRISRSYFYAWCIAFIGLLTGIILNQLNLKFVAPAVTILSMGPLYIHLDQNTTKGLLFGPASVTFLYHVMGYAIGPIGQYYMIGYLDQNVIEFESGFSMAQWGCVIGLFSFSIVYPLIFNYITLINNRMINVVIKESDLDWARYGLLLTLFTVFLLAYGFITGAANRLARLDEVDVAIATVYSSFQLIHQVVFFFLGFTAARKGGGWMIFWIIVYMFYALFFFLDGARVTVVTAGIVSSIGLTMGGISKKRVIIVCLIGSALFIPISGVVSNYRNQYSGRPESVEERLSELIIATGDFAGSTSSGEYGVSDILLRRVTAFTGDRVFILTPDQIPFAGLEGLGNIIYAFVPLIIDPTRPNLRDGNELAIRYGAAPPDSKGSYMTAVGDGYRRFGWTGVALLYAFKAALFGVTTSIFWRFRERREGMAMLILITISASEVMITTLLTNFYIILWVIPKYIVCFISFRYIQEIFIKSVFVRK